MGSRFYLPQVIVVLSLEMIFQKVAIAFSQYVPEPLVAIRCATITIANLITFRNRWPKFALLEIGRKVVRLLLSKRENLFRGKQGSLLFRVKNCMFCFGEQESYRDRDNE
jgi:hypothetical protein